MSITVYIEESGTPIYARIAKALGAELVRLGMSVMVIKPTAFTHETYLAFVRQLSPSTVYLSNAGSNAIQGQLPGKPLHYLDYFQGHVIFLHQDSILSGLAFDQALSKLQAWQRVAQRSAHLSIEPGNVAALREVGIEHVQLVPHASEIQATPPQVDGFDRVASFVGHVVPSVYRQSSGSVGVDALLDCQFKRRQLDFSVAVQDELSAFSAQSLECLGQNAGNQAFRLAHVAWLRGQLMNQSLQFRGWVFEQAQLEGLSIFGGDPAYLHGVERSLRIDRPGLDYQPAVYDMAALNQIFRASAVNINVSSLQFDHAVVNRFHDVVMAGGLCLTDRRDGLPELTQHHQAVSYASMAELEDKVRYYSDPKHRQERAALILAIQKDVVEHSGYPRLAHEIQHAIQQLMA